MAPREIRHLLTMWLGGVVLASLPVIYGVYCLCTGHAILPGRGGLGRAGPILDVYGAAANALAIAYIALGVLAHVHWFWESQPRLWLACAAVKVIALIVLVVSLVLAICWILTSGY